MEKMEKMYLKEEFRNEEEKITGCASYKTIVNSCVDSLILCNNIIDVDNSLYDNFNKNIYEENGDTFKDIYQYYITDISSEHQAEKAEEMGLILAYSDLLDCYILCVDHFGTSWDCVSTDIKLVSTYEELEREVN